MLGKKYSRAGLGPFRWSRWRLPVAIRHTGTNPSAAGNTSTPGDAGGQCADRSGDRGLGVRYHPLQWQSACQNCDRHGTGPRLQPRFDDAEYDRAVRRPRWSTRQRFCVCQRRPGQSDIHADEDAHRARPKGMPLYSARDRRHGWAAGGVSQQRSHYAQHPHCSPWKRRQLRLRHFSSADGRDRATYVSQRWVDDSGTVQQSSLDGSVPERRQEPVLRGLKRGWDAIEIQGLPPGTYTLVAVHEKLGTQSQQITIQSHQASTANFAFSK